MKRHLIRAGAMIVVGAALLLPLSADAFGLIAQQSMWQLFDRAIEVQVNQPNASVEEPRWLSSIGFSPTIGVDAFSATASIRLELNSRRLNQYFNERHDLLGLREARRVSSIRQQQERLVRDLTTILVLEAEIDTLSQYTALSDELTALRAQISIDDAREFRGIVEASVLEYAGVRLDPVLVEQIVSAIRDSMRAILETPQPLDIRKGSINLGEILEFESVSAYNESMARARWLPLPTVELRAGVSIENKTNLLALDFGAGLSIPVYGVPASLTATPDLHLGQPPAVSWTLSWTWPTIVAADPLRVSELSFQDELLANEVNRCIRAYAVNTAMVDVAAASESELMDSEVGRIAALLQFHSSLYIYEEIYENDR